ncbi:MAG: hypothetical protein QXX19_05710 [Candidatus Caldarchaeum sp.]
MKNSEAGLELLLYDEKAELSKVATRLKEFFMIADDGTVLLKKVYPQGMGRLLVYMIGRVAANMMGRVSESSFTLGELTLLTGLRGDQLEQLLAANPYIVYVGHGRYRLNTLYLSKILDELQKLYITEQE